MMTFIENNSELISFDKHIFSEASLQIFEILSSVIELIQLFELTNISINENNCHFSYLNDSFIVGKSELNMQ